MTSTQAIASGVTTAGAGASASGALAGGATGLGGLFASLMGGSSAGAAPSSLAGGKTDAGGSGMISVMLAAPPATEIDAKGPQVAASASDVAQLLAALQASGMAPGTQIDGTGQAATDATSQTDAGQDAQVQASLQLGDAPAVTVTGDADSVASFIAQVKAIYQKLVDQGGLTIDQMSDSKQLASALTKLGMTPEDAQGVAGRIQTMLKVLGKQQKLDAGTQGELSTMMLAVMAQQAGATVAGQAAAASTTAAATADKALSLQIVSVADSGTSAVALNLTAQAGAKAAWRNLQAQDVTRSMLGLDGKAADGKAAATADTAATTDATRRLEVNLSQSGDGSSIGVGLPDITGKPLPTTPQVAVDAKPSDAAQVAATVTNGGAAVRVAANDAIQAPRGETYYKLQADKHGVETLDAVKPMSEARNDAQMGLTAAQMQQQAVATAAGVTTNGSNFAERLAQVQEMAEKAQVGQQVAVQIQPLVDQGGGTIRINLHPKDLGQITVQLSVADGKVHGTIAASEPAVVEQLARELHSLRHGLADAGLKLGDQGINLMLSNQGGNGQSGQNGQNGQTASQFGQGNGNSASGTTAASDETGSITTSLAAWVAPDRVLDVNV